MADQDKHSWKQVDFDESELKAGFNPKWNKKHICKRGDCRCERITSISRQDTFYQYSRQGIMYNERPLCFGDTPINQQTID